MLHPRHHFLSDVTALVEIDAVQAIHVGLMRKRVAIHEIEAAARGARTDAMGLIVGAVDEFGADQIGNLLLEFFGNEDTPAERVVARIGECKIRPHRGFAAPDRQHAEAVGEILDRDLGAQLVEAKLGCKSRRQRTRGIDQKAAAMAGRGLGNQEIGDDLALRRQQCAEPAKARAKQRHVGRNEAVEEVAGILAADLNHAPVWKKRCFHSLKWPFSPFFF